MTVSALAAFCCACGGGGDSWKAKNAAIIAEQKLPMRERAMPTTGVDLKLEGGKVYDSKDVPSIQLG